MPNSSSGEKESPEPSGRRDIRGWAEARETLREDFSFDVKKWYFRPLILLAAVLLMLSLATRSLWLAVLAGVLTLALYYWDKKVGEKPD